MMRLPSLTSPPAAPTAELSWRNDNDDVDDDPQHPDLTVPDWAVVAGVNNKKNIDELMAGLSEPTAMAEQAVASMASYVLRRRPTTLDEVENNNNDDVAHDDNTTAATVLMFAYECEETEAVLLELHRDPLQELEEYFASLIGREEQEQQQEMTSFFALPAAGIAGAAQQEEEEMTERNDNERCMDDTKEDDDAIKGYDEDEDFGDFQTALSLEHRQEEEEEAEVLSGGGAIVQQALSATSQSSIFAAGDEQDTTIKEELLTTTITATSTRPSIVETDHHPPKHLLHQDQEDMLMLSPLASSFIADTCDLERQAVDMLGRLSCRSSRSDSLDTPDLLAQAEAMLLQPTMLSFSHHPQPTTPMLATPRPFVGTPLRSSPPRSEYDDDDNETRVSPPSAQVRRRQQQLQQQQRHSTFLPTCKDENEMSHPNTNDENETTTRLSLRLPVDDLNSLLGRFILRRQRHHQRQQQRQRRMKNSAIDVEAGGPPRPTVAAEPPQQQQQSSMEQELGLPDYYFKPPSLRNKSSSLDDTVRILRDMPWQFVDDWNEWDDAITHRLCHLDDALRQLQTMSVKALAPHRHDRLDMANRNLHDVEQAFRLAEMYWERSNDAVEAAHNGWGGYQTYREEFSERANLQQLASLLQRVENLVAHGWRLVDRVEHFMVTDPGCVQEYTLLVEQRRTLRVDLADDALANVACLVDVQRNVEALPDTFRERLFGLLHILVARSCRGRHHDTLWEEYSRLVRLLEMVSTDTEDEARRWADTIHKVMLLELDRCLVVALVEPEAVEDSEYDVELRKLLHNANGNSVDAMELRTTAHNLGLIRFDLELDKRYLPRVVRNLCRLLADCLYRYRLFKQWHRNPVVNDGSCDEPSLDSLPSDTLNGSSPFNTSTVELLQDGTTDLWKNALSVVARCFQEYLDVAPNRSFFRRTKNGIDDSLWKADLIDLYECVTISERMINLKNQICGESPHGSLVESEQNLMEQVRNVIRRHLRGVHVEAMNSLGRKLSTESWSLVMFSHQCEPETTGRPVADAYTLVQKALEAADPFPGSSLQREIDQRRQSNGVRCHSRFANILDETCSNDESHRSYQPTASSLANGTEVEEFLDSIIRSCDDEPRLASSSLCEDVLGWFGRLFAILTHLKLVTDDVAAVFANVTDLYMMTVLRICSGSRKVESIMLGVDLPSAFVFPKFQVEVDESAAAKQTQYFGSFRKRPSLLTTRRSVNTPIPADLHADICSPLPTEQGSLVAIRDFVFRAQRSLTDIVNLDMVDQWLSDSKAGDSVEEKACLASQILMKREAAIMSSIVLSYVLAIMVDNANRPQGELKAFQSYARSLLHITLPLSRITRKIATVRSLNCAELVKDILAVGDVWDESKLHESANSYVDEVSDLCALLWGYLNASGKMPAPLQATVWHSILQMVYVSFVEGFSRITSCSTEGRSLMSLDTACLAANLSRKNVQERCSHVVLADLPPETRMGDFNRTHVESYIKAYYLPVNDAMQWITANAPMFHMNHSIALIVAVALSSSPDAAAHGREAAVRHLVEEVKVIYRQQQ
jgi:hypothetical protein